MTVVFRVFFWGGGSWGGDSGERGGKSGGGGFAGELRGSPGEAHELTEMGSGTRAV